MLEPKKMERKPISDARKVQIAERRRKVVSTMRELLMDPNKKKVDAENIPAILFRDITASHGIMPMDWERLIDRHYRLLYGDDLQKVSQEKTNLQRALVKPNLTWARYYKFLEILGVESMTFIQQLHSSDGRVYEHKVKTRNRYALRKVQDAPDVE